MNLKPIQLFYLWINLKEEILKRYFFVEKTLINSIRDAYHDAKIN